MQSVAEPVKKFDFGLDIPRNVCDVLGKVAELLNRGGKQKNGKFNKKLPFYTLFH